jgi:site-specific recombinase XerD
MTELVPAQRGGLAVPVQKTEHDEAAMLAAAFLAGYSGRTREAYFADLRQYGAWCASRGIGVLAAGRAHVQVYARELEDAGRARSTIARKLSAIAGFYGYAVAEGAIARSPVAHVRRPRVPDESPRLGLTAPELQRLLAAAAAAGAVPHALICLLALNGLRVSEACGARTSDVGAERDHQVLEVTRKGGKRARVPLARRTAAALEALPCWAKRDPVNCAAAPTGTSRPPLGLDRYAAWRLVVRLADAAGIAKQISPHSLRHTFVTLSLDAGVPLRDVQDAAGHADPRTTRRYDRGRQSLDRHATYALENYLGN